MGEELTTTALLNLLEDRRLEGERRVVRLHERIDSLKDELYEEIEKSHNEIMEEIRQMRLDQKIHTKEEYEILDKLDRRIAEIEKWRWLVVGGAAAVAFLVFGGIDGLIDLVQIKK